MTLSPEKQLECQNRRRLGLDGFLGAAHLLCLELSNELRLRDAPTPIKSSDSSSSNVDTETQLATTETQPATTETQPATASRLQGECIELENYRDLIVQETKTTLDKYLKEIAQLKEEISRLGLVRETLLERPGRPELDTKVGLFHPGPVTT